MVSSLILSFSFCCIVFGIYIILLYNLLTYSFSIVSKSCVNEFKLFSSLKDLLNLFSSLKILLILANPSHLGTFNFNCPFKLS